MVKRSLSASWALVALLGASLATADWSQTLGGALQQLGGSQAATSLADSALSDSEITAGLKEALASGVEKAINELGRTDGFLANELVRIALPDALRSVEQVARGMGGGAYVDELVMSMNRAAEQAVPEAAEVMGDAIRKMTLSDARAILNGPDDAATRYFRKVANDDLGRRFLPIVKQATGQSGVASAYKGLMGQAGGSMLGGFLGGGADLDAYVTDKTLDGFYKYLAIQEKAIRDNPASRSSDLLQRVFGAGG